MKESVGERAKEKISGNLEEKPLLLILRRFYLINCQIDCHHELAYQIVHIIE